MLPCSSRTFWSLGRLMPIGVIGPDSPVSITTSMALAVMPLTSGLRNSGRKRHVVLEPLGVDGQLLDLHGLLPVDVEDQRLPGALHAARVHVDLDEPVDGVHRRRLVGHPGDVEGPAIGVLAGAIPLHEPGQGLLHRRRREGLRGLEMADHGADLRVVAAAHLVDLFDQRAVLLDQPRVEAVALGEALQVGHRHARSRGCWRWPAGCPCRRRRLLRDHRLEGRIEEHRPQARQQRASAASGVVRSAVVAGKVAPFFAAWAAAAASASGVQFSRNLRAVRLL